MSTQLRSIAVTWVTRPPMLSVPAVGVSRACSSVRPKAA